jgi:hypothetical protein
MQPPMVSTPMMPMAIIGAVPMSPRCRPEPLKTIASIASTNDRQRRPASTTSAVHNDADLMWVDFNVRVLTQLNRDEHFFQHSLSGATFACNWNAFWYA